jgi:BirA family transcriptional regulator, biotin operon repressor / biotin---[acetyl-CoA-carboxylase] ligase
LSLSDFAGFSWSNLRFLESTDSTNQAAREWAQDGAPDGATMVADFQRQGRGRLNRIWHSPPDLNLYFSQIIRLPTDRLRLAPLLGAVAAQEVINGCLQPLAKATIKWPNDILAQGLKLAGILAEGIQSQDPAAVLGIGVNLNTTAKDFPSDLRRPAGSVCMITGRLVDRPAFLLSLLESMARWREILRLQPEQLIETLRNNCSTLGGQVRVSIPNQPIFCAIAKTIAPDGALVVENKGKLIRIEAGDVDPVSQE